MSYTFGFVSLFHWCSHKHYTLSSPHSENHVCLQIVNEKHCPSRLGAEQPTCLSMQELFPLFQGPLIPPKRQQKMERGGISKTKLSPRLKRWPLKTLCARRIRGSSYMTSLQKNVSLFCFSLSSTPVCKCHRIPQNRESSRAPTDARRKKKTQQLFEDRS